VVRDRFVQLEVAEPTIGEVEMDFFAYPAL
jgi:hypothetical protein